ncbi:MULTISPECIES: hypothetical protein [Corynebacterium]|uniref:Uncharacterized protein n=1 Tax=Corynebacterium gallinarum TaxID=2762214 RepID=A0A8I0LFD1_9CORY|nr:MULTISPECIES: hypothetical protein [Corynebacterium]MBD8029554.1 hypothetical protein [Corynebacterium gallinarum]
MEWTEVVSQALPALAAIFGGLVTGGVQYINRNGDRKHERQLKKDEHAQEERRTSQERAYANIERQEEAVKRFLHMLREQQAAIAETRLTVRENRADEEYPTFEERLKEEQIVGEVAYIGRRKVIQAWDMLELVATDGSLKEVSATIGKALREDNRYSDTDIFPAADLGSHYPEPQFEDLLSDLREATARMHLPNNVVNRESKDT